MGILLLTSRSAIYKAKQKPRQWGPLSAVRSAVFHNAERLGIDPASIVGLWPFWEGGGAPGYFSGAGLKRWRSTWIATPGQWVVRENSIGYYHTDVLYFSTVDWGGKSNKYSAVWYLSAPQNTGYKSVSGFSGDYYDVIKVGSNTSYALYMFTELFAFSGETYEGIIRYKQGVDPLTVYCAWQIDGDGLWYRHIVDGFQQYYWSGLSGGPFRARNDDGRLYNNTAGAYNTELFLLIFNTIIPDNILYAITGEQPYALIQPVARPLVFDLGVGGTVYNVSVLDGLVAGDTLSGLATYLVSVTDGVATGDSDSGVGNFAVSALDGVNCGDSCSYGATLIVSVGDGITLADVASGNADIVVSLGDGATFGEVLAVAAAFAPTATDGVTFGDTSSYGGIINVLVSDGLITTDQAQAAADILATITDSITVSDSGTVRCDFTVTVNDGVQLADVLNAIAQFAATVTDGFTAGDTPRYVPTSTGLAVTFYAKNRVYRFDVKVRSFILNAKTH